jgi:catechol 2,3-dioxygenase-like lactoylglutathione lyase family enzyme
MIRKVWRSVARRDILTIIDNHRRNLSEKLIELAYFTDHVKEMADFYRTLLHAEPVTQSDDMAIFLSGEAKVFIHKTYPASEGELPPENHIAFAVPDVDSACASLTQGGLTLEVPPKDYYMGALRLPARSGWAPHRDHQRSKMTES